MKILSKKKFIVIFLKNKLISLDSVIPLVLEINRCCNYNFYFVIWEYETYQSVINDNIVLRDMALSVGKIVCPSRPDRNIFSNKINKILLLTDILLKFYSRKSYMLHFGALNVRPLSFFVKIIKKHRIALCESSSIFSSSINNSSKVDTILQSRSSKKIFNKYIKNRYPVNSSGILIGFNLDWNWFKHPDADYCKKLIFSDVLYSKAYLEFIEKNSNFYLNQENLLDLDKNKTIVVILGHYGWGSPKDQSIRNNLLYEVLLVLRDLEMNIIIKPHVFCDMRIVSSLVERAECVDSKIYYTKVYPNILQKVSIAGLFVNSSAVRCHYKFTGFPVIQYNGNVEGSGVIFDDCSDVICSDKNQLMNHLESLMENYGTNTTIKKEVKSGCNSIKNIVDCSTAL